jgi:hypothetical protein
LLTDINIHWRAILSAFGQKSVRDNLDKCE